jgi:group II intron reverse transcriptase/maturase
MAKGGRWSDGEGVEVRDMRDAETTLAIIRERGKAGSHLEDVYRRLYNPDLFLRAYGRIYRNAGAMTKGTTEETVDGMSQRKIGKTIGLLRNERYRWTPVRRTFIPKSNGKLRPLGIPTWSDKLLQEVMRSILEAFYEPQFSPTSHGFRPGLGCHTALRAIHSWSGVVWFIEGDIKGCFDNIDHTILMSILREKIRDNRFLDLVEGLLRAGHLERWNYRPTLSGTPQGGIVSPLLANIYLDGLDKFVEQTLIPEFTKGDEKRRRPEYNRLYQRIRRLEAAGAHEDDLKPLRAEFRSLGANDPFDPNYRRLRYVRYADDFLLGFDGPREEAEEIKVRLGAFLRDRLKLELSPEKTLITHAKTDEARFLGYEISTWSNPGRPGHGRIMLRMPLRVIEVKIARYTREGKPVHRAELIHDSDLAIVDRYGQELRGYAQYYAHAKNRTWLHRLKWYMQVSLLKTLAAKHKSSISKMAKRFASRAITETGLIKCYKVVVKREGKPPLVAAFGDISLKTQPFKVIEDLPTDRDRIFRRNELIQRLMIDECELCGSRDRVQSHHVRKLADLKVNGRATIPTWKQVMIARRRKTLMVCHHCHTAIHAGRPTRTRSTKEAAFTEDRPLESRVL